MDCRTILPNGEEILVELKKQHGHQNTGSDLFVAFFNKMGLSKDDQQYFGLLYCNKEDGRMDWLEKDDILKSIPKNKASSFHLSVRYYPQNPELVIKEDETRRLFCFQIKEKLLRGEWGCDVETHACLDGLLVQATIGDYNPTFHKAGYLQSLKGVEISSPSRLNSDHDPKEKSYLHKVHYHHKRNLGISQSEAEILYLKKARTLPLYGYIIHTAVDCSNNELCVGLREQGIVIFDNPSFAHCDPLLVRTEFSWDHLKFCTSSKCKVKLGVTIQSGNICEIVWKVKTKNCFRGSKRLCDDIKAFRDIYASRDESDFVTSKKEIRRARSFTSPSNNIRPKFQRINSVTTSIRNSLRRKKKKGNENMDTSPSTTSFSKEETAQTENALDHSRVILVVGDDH